MKLEKTLIKNFRDSTGAVRTGLAALMFVGSLAAALSSAGCGSQGADAIGPNGALQPGYTGGLNGVSQCYTNNTPGVYYNNTCMAQQQTYVCEIQNGVNGITSTATPGVCNPVSQPIQPTCNYGDRLMRVAMNGLQNVFLCEPRTQVIQPQPMQPLAQPCGGQYPYSHNQQCYGTVQWNLTIH